MRHSDEVLRQECKGPRRSLALVFSLIGALDVASALITLVMAD